MKHTRRLSALLLCLTLAGASSTALAAPSKTFSEVPTVKVTMFKNSEIDSYETDVYTLDANLPGFLTVRLLDASGSEVMVCLDNFEIHSKENIIDFVAQDAEGNPLPAGKYTLSFDLVSQFGVASKTVTKDIIVEEMSAETREMLEEQKAKDEPVIEEEPEAEEEVTEAIPEEETADEETSDEDAAQQTKPTAAPTAAPAAAPTAAPAKTTTSDGMTYTEGSYKMGDEGLQIGVGVTDTASQEDAGFWGLDSDASDEEIWAALTRQMTTANVGEKESAYIYDSAEKGRKKIGTISGISQGLNVVYQRDDGWSLVEAFRNEDGAFVRGYIKTDKLRTVDPNTTYGIVIDKNTQTLTVFKNGQRLGSCKVSTGLATPKYPHRETPAGEFITVSRRGSTEYYGNGFSRYTIRINGSYHISEIPTTKKNGSTFTELKEQLGTKATRGNVCIASDASADGGINAKWIWDLTDENKKVKVLIFDDKERTEVPVTEK